MRTHKGGGIWKNNIRNKPKLWRKKEGNRIKRKTKICIICRKRVVKFHHTMCPKCWQKKQQKEFQW